MAFKIKESLYIPPVSPILPLFNKVNKNIDESRNENKEFSYYLLLANIQELERKYNLKSDDFIKVMERNIPNEDKIRWIRLLKEFDIRYNV